MADYASLLRDHVPLKCRCIDRVFLQAYVPKLQSVGQVCTFLRWIKGFKIPSSAAFGKIGQAYVKAIHRFAEEHKIPVVHFKKGENKEEMARPYLEAAAKEGQERVVLIGIAQEKASVWRSWKGKGQETAAHPHMEWGREMAYIKHFYFYLWDAEWGGTFWKTNAYAPDLSGGGSTATSGPSGNWRKRASPPWTTDSALAPIPKRCRASVIGWVRGPCAASFWRWWWRLPSPFSSEDFEAGYTYELAFRQFEVSETCVFDRPQAGRMWFEGVIRDHLDIGRPEQVALIFDRRVTRRTPGSFRSRVLRRGVDPVLSCYYKSSRIKQYFKDGRALRTETVICNSYDFGVGRRVCARNW